MPAKSFKEIKISIRSSLPVLREKYFVRKIGIFGSYAKSRQSKKSDIDILVSFSRPVGLFHFVHTQDYLKRILKCKIDLVTPQALKPEIKKDVLSRVKYI